MSVAAVFLAALVTALATGLGIGASIGLIHEGAGSSVARTAAGALLGVVFIVATTQLLGHDETSGSGRCEARTP